MVPDISRGTRRGGALAVLLAAAVAQLPSTLAAQARAPESVRYVAGANVDLCGAFLANVAVGRACFAVGPERQLSITLVDDAGLASPGTYAFEDGNFNVLGQGSFCQSIDSVNVPKGATQLAVYTVELLPSSIPLPPADRCTAAPSLSGIVTVYFGPVVGGTGTPAAAAAGGARHAQPPPASWHPAAMPHTADAAPARSVRPIPL